ncbi:MAG: MarR family transcriptional regulator [Mariniphaga sp.]
MGSEIPLGYMLNRSRRVFKNQMATELREKKIDLSFEQYVILKLLHFNTNLIQQDLADRLQKDKSIIVRHINCLLEHNYVVRVTNQADQRKKNLTLTSDGVAILNQMKVIAADVTNKLLVGVSETELQIFQDVLLKIQENGDLEDDLCIVGDKKR